MRSAGRRRRVWRAARRAAEQANDRDGSGNPSVKPVRLWERNGRQKATERQTRHCNENTLNFLCTCLQTQRPVQQQQQQQIRGDFSVKLVIMSLISETDW